MKYIKYVGNALLTIVILLFAVTAAISFFSGPDDEGLLGYKGYTVVSGSMEPVFSAGDFIFVKTTPIEEIETNDIVTFIRNEEFVTHRAVEISETGLVTKGDANNIADQGEVTEENYVGELALIVPYFGYVVVATQQPLVLGGLVALLGFYYILIYVKQDKEEKQRVEDSAD
ncbi:signal peptidase I [Desemzia sp. RIT804]|uniref:signal peptidase I n=1 Tax=Desemzia sp. RIT 804 TaxID=2810209 RepID=UPI001950F9D8|nr:signal peptidase I [Desemzia sp. RIT 804]